MTSEIIIENLNSMLEKVMDELSVKNYRMEIDGQSETGDNYMGEVIFFRIIPEDDKEVYHFVMKTAKRSEEFRNKLPIEKIYNRELFMYSEVFPYFRKFIDEMNPNFEFDNLPKLYYVDKGLRQETLIFENLKTNGYKLHDRKTPWNLEHSMFVMEQYGKYHALSFAIKDQKPEVFKHLTKNMTNLAEEFGGANMKRIYEEPFNRVMALLAKVGRDDLVKKFAFLMENIETIFIQIEEDDKLVIGHSDCWNNNFMFKYKDEDETTPSKMCFLDFQLSTIDSPVRDLAYNIYSTCDRSCLDHFDLLLETYYKSLSSSIRSLGSNPDELFTYEQLKQHWTKYSQAGLILSTIIIKIELLDKADAPDIAKLTEDGKNIEECFDITLKDYDEYNRRILDVFLHYGDKFL
ncbi:hypothetical protein HHI36_012463 [Cryptolaemus montrouzieri]|uniref:CHK kinase-like domain-containing protein n=1 Tax=Cryptolaemus montrouzieri TaxID=559131 RepID=A0ABD2NF11_9CUCU